MNWLTQDKSTKDNAFLSISLPDENNQHPANVNSIIFNVKNPQMENDPLFKFRQPLVTAAGIILGFVLSFVAALVKRDSKNEGMVLLVIFSILVGIVLLIVALYRILNNRYDQDQANAYYRKTLKIFLTGVILSFFGGVLKMIHTLFIAG